MSSSALEVKEHVMPERETYQVMLQITSAMIFFIGSGVTGVPSGIVLGAIAALEWP